MKLLKKIKIFLVGALVLFGCLVILRDLTSGDLSKIIVAFVFVGIIMPFQIWRDHKNWSKKEREYLEQQKDTKLEEYFRNAK